MTSSLEKLVTNLSREGDAKFKVLKKYVNLNKVSLLLRKGVYPYEYMDSLRKFEEPGLPAIDQFYSSLTESAIPQENYEHAQQVFQDFQCRGLGDYHNLYLKSDVLLLADV